MSVKVELYQAIKAELESIPSVKNVLHYNGQDLLDYEKDNPKRWPQYWIQLSSIEWLPSELKPNQSNRTQQQKSAAVTITIYYATYSLNEDDETFEDDLTAVDLSYRALTMIDGDNFGPLQRVSESDTATNNNVRVWAQTYTTKLTECAIANTDVDAAPVQIVINKTI
jgi:hypothetical protein